MNVHLLETLAFAVGIASLSYAARMLSASGAIAQFVLGAMLFGLGGWQWTIPMLAFFLTSSMLSRLSSVRKAEAADLFSKGEIRDASQVAANGGLSGVLILGSTVYPHPAWFIAYLSSVAAAAADTWATEVGALSTKDPVLLLSMKPVPPGTSGGVSVLGTFAALAGAAVVLISGLWWIEPALAARSAYLVITSGLTGTTIDSVLGGTLQSQFRCRSCGKLTEKGTHCGGQTEHIRGIPWIQNDLVNLFCTLGAAILGGVSTLFLE
ncbi:MAG TPA: DUF92 domain-containing protein [Bacteroidota bacterium]|nr:DUF92 domain-containing protein [Bacteroidota bacterium]